MEELFHEFDKACNRFATKNKTGFQFSAHSVTNDPIHVWQNIFRKEDASIRSTQGRFLNTAVGYIHTKLIYRIVIIKHGNNALCYPVSLHGKARRMDQLTLIVYFIMNRKHDISCPAVGR